MRRHSWYRRWWQYLVKERECENCGARVRISRSGPRGGARYYYRGPGFPERIMLDRMPNCRRGFGVGVDEAPPVVFP